MIVVFAILTGALVAAVILLQDQVRSTAAAQTAAAQAHADTSRLRKAYASQIERLDAAERALTQRIIERDDAEAQLVRCREQNKSSTDRQRGAAVSLQPTEIDAVLLALDPMRRASALPAGLEPHLGTAIEQLEGVQKQWAST